MVLYFFILAGVTCMSDSNNYGFVNGKSCVLIRVAKVK